MTLETRIYAADRAGEVLNNEVFNQVWQDYRLEITNQWQNSPARDQEGREKLWLMLKLADKLESHLRTSLETGTMARLELTHQQNMFDRAKSAIGMT